jgi:DNA-binding NarL/FixJ family response regulator
VQVVIAEDSGLFRQALIVMLDAVGVRVSGAFATGEALLQALDRGLPEPDVAILDLHMPPTFTDEGTRAALRLRERHPALPVLILSAFNETPQAMALFELSGGGASYLLKDNVTDAQTLRACLQRLQAGEMVVDPAVVSRLVAARQRSAEIAVLSPRERDVLGLMAQGLSNAGIARQLALSARTAEDHVRAVFVKLGIGGATDDPVQGQLNKRVLAVLTWLRATTAYPCHGDPQGAGDPAGEDRAGGPTC